jgi:glycosyltransferase involved in cell wall biosynthesis
MKNILYPVSTTKYFSGAEWSIYRLARAIGGRHSVTFAVPDSGDLFRVCRKHGMQAVVVEYMPAGKQSLLFPRIISFIFTNLFYIVRLMFHIVRLKVDIVHVNEIYNFPAMVAARLTGRKTVCHLRAGVLPPRPLLQFTRWVAATFCHRIICVSNAVRELWFGTDHYSGKIEVIHNPHPDIERFDPDRVHGEGGDRLVVGCVSKICEQKAQHHLVEAAGIIRDTGIDDIEFVIVGGALKGHEAYYNMLLKIVKSLALDDRITLRGMQPNTPAELSRMDVFVHTPDFPDPFPTVVLEAMMMRKPVVCFSAGGIPEQLEDGVSGVLVAPGKSEDLAKAIVDLHRNAGKRRELGENARKHVISRLSPRTIANKVSDLYDRL